MKARKVALFMVLVLVVLVGFSFVAPADGINIGGQNIRYPSLKKVLSPDHQPTVAELIGDSTEVAELGGLVDTVAYYRRLVASDSSQIRFWLPSDHYLDPFWEACERAQADSTTLRVLHYGDSQIEMDHISSRLRSYMQRTFGGGGPGMLPFRSITATPTVHQSTDGNLIHLASFGDSTVVKSRGNYGVMMQCFRLDGAASTTVRPASSRQSKVDSLARRFTHVGLIYNNRGSFSASAASGKQGGTSRQAKGKGVGRMDWEVPADAKSVSVKASGNADLYCLLLDDGAGVTVDNIPMRGCSGQQFTLADASLLSAAYSQMNVGLIIMQFGGNSVPYFKSSQAISTYCRSIGKQIDYVHTACPGARILFIGPSDMSTKRNGQYVTYPLLPELIDSLCATANAHEAAYWSIYHAMGGHNSMTQWSRQGLAGKDYIHFSQKGSDLMGDRLATAFDNAYRLYVAEHRLAAEQQKQSGKKRKKGGKR